MVNIPMVSVKNATFSFGYEITSAVPQKKSEKTSLNLSGKYAQIKGRVAKGKEAGQETASLKVKVELERPQMPVGVDRLLDILELSASESKDK
jgi:gas vesicle protein